MKKLIQAAMRRTNFNLRKNLNGTRFRVPILGGLGKAMRRHHEPWMVDLLVDLEKHAGGVFVDVGVNLGQTLLAMKSVRPEWDYIGFEPNPYCVYYTMNLIEANGIDHCTIFPFGIGERTGAMDLHLNTVTGGEASIVEGFREKYKRRIKVPILGKDVLPAEVLEREVGVLKVDVEGGELEVFQAMEAVLERDHPIIITEFMPVYDASTKQGAFRQERQDALLSLLLGLGYRLVRLHVDGRRERLDGIEVHGEMKWTNYLLVPEGRAEELLH